MWVLNFVMNSNFIGPKPVYLLNLATFVTKSAQRLCHRHSAQKLYTHSAPFFNLPENKQKEEKLRRFIIDSQLSLRKEVQKLGDMFAEHLWLLRIQDKTHLKEYAVNMYELSTNCWNSYKKMNLRISWSHDNIKNYFFNGKINTYIKEEKRISKCLQEFQGDFIEREAFYDLEYNSNSIVDKPLQVLDVGSCYNPFGIYDNFDVTAIDISPAIAEVKECDFLTVKLKDKEDYQQVSNSKKFYEPVKNCCSEEKSAIKDFINNLNDSISLSDKCDKANCIESSKFVIKESNMDNSKIEALYKESFDAIIFCLFIGYIPSPRLRYLCCQKAYDLLKVNGLLCIITPVSFYRCVNVHFADLWKLTLEHMGFQCIKCKEHKHFHGLIFRKSICKNLFKLEAERELEELLCRKESFAGSELKMFANFDYNSIFKNFYIHQDLLGFKDKVP